MQLEELIEKPTQEVKTFDWAEVENAQFKLKNKTSLRKLNASQLGSPELVELYNKSLENFKSTPLKNEIVKGKVLAVINKVATVNINCRESGYIDMSKESTEYLDYIVEGNLITAKVISNSDEKGFINLSFTDAVYQSKHTQILESINTNTAYLGLIKSLVPGGYAVIIDGIETFMPGSLAGVNKLHDFEVMLGQSVYVVAVNYERNNIVVSHREYLHKLIPGKIEELKSNTNELITGFVTGSTQYGIFCEFNECLTGMILSSDLTDEYKELHVSRQIKPGMKMEFYVKEIVSNKKIILTQIFKEDPWDTITEKYKLPALIKGKITTIKEYGAFVLLSEGLTGLLHSSEYAGKNLKEGDEIDVKLTRIDTSTKKLYLSIK